MCNASRDEVQQALSAGKHEHEERDRALRQELFDVTISWLALSRFLDSTS